MRATFKKGLRLWPWLLCLLVVITIALFGPVLLNREASLQIRVSHQGTALPDGFYVWQSLNARGIQLKSITPAPDSLIINFESYEQSIEAQKALQQIFPYGFIVARTNNKPAEKWLQKVGLKPS